jgi:aminoglycoside phosphotransferase family enzyme/predicted kinase
LAVPIDFASSRPADELVEISRDCSLAWSARCGAGGPDACDHRAAGMTVCTHHWLTDDLVPRHRVEWPLPVRDARHEDGRMNSSTAAMTITDPLRELLHAPAAIRETHTGIVVLVGDRAYKVKKPVITDFLDFSTPERREQVCAREVVLNSRLARDSYLGVAHFDNLGQAAPEPVIVMRRYPDSLRLSTMAAAGEPVERHIVRIAEALARFHDEASRSRAIDACAKVPEITRRWEENITELRRYLDTVLSTECLSEVARLATQFISGRSDLFEERIADRRIVDGHGDLLADDIFCLPEGPALLDCLEFDDQLRYVDCVDDAAFLAMDLEFVGREDLADEFTSHYLRLTGDPAPKSLWHFYIAYRAVVRAKVDCIRVDQGAAGAVADAQHHLDIALARLRAGTVRLILVGGGPGTGKTTLAHALAESLGAEVISTDEVRRGLRESGDIDGPEGMLNAGLYSTDNVQAVYDTVLRRASLALVRGRSVILDGTWRDPRQRQRARDVANEHHCPTVELACIVPLSDAMGRLSARPPSSSDATPHIAAAMGTDEHQYSGMHHVDTARPPGDSAAEAYELCCLAI